MAPKSPREAKPPTTGSSSPVLWLLFALWSLAIVYGSLWPWQAWREIGSAPWAFLGDPWPRYWTWFDFFSNLALYAPLGLLLALNLAPRRKAMLWLPLLIGCLLSLSIETAQSYLPQRVPSVLDLVANTLGAFFGALAAAGLGRPWQKMRRLSRHWWRDDAQWPAVLVILWLAIRVTSLLSPKQAGITMPPAWLVGSESIATGLGLGAGWLLVESLLLSLMLAQVCRSAWVFWLSLSGAQCLLMAGMLGRLLQGPPLTASMADFLPLIVWILILAGWAYWHRQISVRGAGLLGLGIASLWALRTVIVLMFASLVAEAEQSSLGPGLGPSPNSGLGLSTWLLTMEEAWQVGLAGWRSALDPYWQALLDLWFGLGQAHRQTFGSTPVLGRSLQHFEAVVIGAQELWRWMCLLWFTVAALAPKQAAIRPRRRL
jgi:VanZ family protein